MGTTSGSAPENDIAHDIVDAAFKVHTTLGPGLLESAYEAVLAHELSRRGHRVGRQVPIPVTYDDRSSRLASARTCW